MLTLGRTSILLIAVLTLVYVCFFFYLREGAKMRLEQDWEEAGQPGDRGDWVAQRLKPRADRIMRWLILFVYVLPIAALSAIVYFSS